MSEPNKWLYVQQTHTAIDSQSSWRTNTYTKCMRYGAFSSLPESGSNSVPEDFNVVAYLHVDGSKIPLIDNQPRWDNITGCVDVKIKMQSESSADNYRPLVFDDAVEDTYTGTMWDNVPLNAGNVGIVDYQTYTYQITSSGTSFFRPLTVEFPRPHATIDEVEHVAEYMTQTVSDSPLGSGNQSLTYRFSEKVHVQSFIEAERREGDSWRYCSCTDYVQACITSYYTMSGSFGVVSQSLSDTHSDKSTTGFDSLDLGPYVSVLQTRLLTGTCDYRKVCDIYTDIEPWWGDGNFVETTFHVPFRAEFPNERYTYGSTSMSRSMLEKFGLRISETTVGNLSMWDIDATSYSNEWIDMSDQWISATITATNILGRPTMSYTTCSFTAYGTSSSRRTLYSYDMHRWSGWESNSLR